MEQSKEQLAVTEGNTLIAEFNGWKEQVIQNGYEDEINWQRNLKECADSISFAREAIWVILNSGMREQIARKIWERIQEAWFNKQPTSSAFRHKGKVNAIDFVWTNHQKLFIEYLSAADRIAYLKTIPFIGNITCYHLAKNLGVDCVKPDRHIVRIAGYYKTTPNDLCKKISDETGEKMTTIDIILWRACNLGIINTQQMITQCNSQQKPTINNQNLNQ